MDSAVLQSKSAEYLESNRCLYGDGNVPPKFHYMMHLGQYRWKRLPNTLALERKHKHVKCFANEVRNTGIDWDQSVHRETTSSHLARLASAGHMTFAEVAGLIGGRKPGRKMLLQMRAVIGEFPADTLRTSAKARVNKYEIMSVGDVVLVGECSSPIIGKVAFHASVSDSGATEITSVIEEFTIQEALQRSWKCTNAGKLSVFNTSDVFCALISAGDAILTVLKPIHAIRSSNI